MREAAADALPCRHLHVAAEDDRRHEPLAQRRVVVDLAADQPDQHRRTLRVADQDERPSVVLVAQVVLPAGEQAPEGDAGGGRVARQVEQPRHGLLAVHRRPDPADLREPRRLLDCGRCLRRLDLQVGVRRLLQADRRIDVEAVEARAWRPAACAGRGASRCRRRRSSSCRSGTGRRRRPACTATPSGRRAASTARGFEAPPQPAATSASNASSDQPTAHTRQATRRRVQLIDWGCGLVDGDGRPRRPPSRAGLRGACRARVVERGRPAARAVGRNGHAGGGPGVLRGARAARVRLVLRARRRHPRLPVDGLGRDRRRGRDRGRVGDVHRRAQPHDGRERPLHAGGRADRGRADRLGGAARARHRRAPAPRWSSRSPASG